MTKPPIIALLADFPLECLTTKEAPLRHYATWLLGLYEIFSQVPHFEIHWLVLSKDHKHITYRHQKGQHFHILPRHSKTLGLSTGYLHERKLISECLRNISPDLVHAWGTEDCYALAGGDVKGRKILSIQGLLRLCVKHAPMDRFTRLHSFYEGRAMRRFPLITGESPYALKHITAIAPQSRVEGLEYAVDEAFFHTPRQLSRDPSFLFVGTATAPKNLNFILRVFAHQELSQYKLFLAGVRPDQINQPTNNIRPLGRLNREELRHQLSKAWALVCPSLCETGPTIVKEARVMGIPVIISSKCGSKQYIIPTRSGHIIPPNNEQELLKALLYWAKDKQANITAGLYQQEECRELLCPALMAQELTAIYNRELRLQ